MTFARKHGWRSRSLAQLSLSCALTAALAAALAGCAGSSGTGQTAAGASGRTGTSSGAAAGAGVAGAGVAGAGVAGAGAGVPANGGNAAANVPAAARTLLCPPPITSSRPGSSASRSIPAGFTAVAVVRCIPTAAFGPAQGSWAYAQKQVAVSGLGPLLAALREPSAQHVRPGPASRCPVPAASGVRLALVGADGAVVYPRIPVTTCGAPIRPVTTSLAALHWIPLSPPVGGAASAPQTAGGTSN